MKRDTPMKHFVSMMKTKPYAHQEKEFIEHGLDTIRAIFWEMGCGKSKLIVDTACALYKQKKIDTVIILAPNIVHSNWTLREFPAHKWDDVILSQVTWDSKKATTKKFKKAFEHASSWGIYPGGELPLFILAVNYEGILSDHADKLLVKLLGDRKCLMVCDESSRIKTPKAKGSKRCIKLGRLADYRRILTGTPYTTGPFDIYAQVRFMDPHYLGFKTFTAFKSRYAEFDKEFTSRMVNGKSVKVTYDQLVCYRNLDDLKERMDPISTRLTKFECLDLPERTYQTYEIDMTKQQRLMYDTLKQELILYLEHEGELSQLVTPNALSLLTRLQQIVGGFVANPERGIVLPCDQTNPKTALIKELVDDIIESGHQVVIWARFQAEIDALTEALDEYSIVQFHGRVSDANKTAAIDLFQDGTAKILIGNQASGGMGITLTAGCYMIYMSNSFSLDQRLQSEARIHRIGQLNRCTYIDVIAKNSTDNRIRERLIENHDLATTLTGDEVMEWLT